jgi:hypothetical protein
MRRDHFLQIMQVSQCADNNHITKVILPYDRKDHFVGFARARRKCTFEQCKSQTCDE